MFLRDDVVIRDEVVWRIERDEIVEMWLNCHITSLLIRLYFSIVIDIQFNYLTLLFVYYSY